MRVALTSASLSQVAEERAAFRELAAKVFTGPDPSGADIPTHDLDEFYLVASWFRRRPREKARTRVAMRRARQPEA